MSPRLLIVGYGNLLMGDDGAGLAVTARLRQVALPADVRLEDGETDALALRSMWRGEPDIWLIDAVCCDLPPGSVRDIRHDDLLAIPQAHATAHQLSVPESLRWLSLTYPEMAEVRFRLWGISAAHVRAGQGLSVEVAAGVESTAQAICKAAWDRASGTSSG